VRVGTGVRRKDQTTAEAGKAQQISGYREFVGRRLRRAEHEHAAALGVGAHAPGCATGTSMGWVLASESRRKAVACTMLVKWLKVFHSGKRRLVAAYSHLRSAEQAGDKSSSWSPDAICSSHRNTIPLPLGLQKTQRTCSKPSARRTVPLQTMQHRPLPRTTSRSPRSATAATTTPWWPGCQTTGGTALQHGRGRRMEFYMG